MATATATADDMGVLDGEPEEQLLVEDFASSPDAAWARERFEALTAGCPLSRAKELSCGERDRRALSDSALAYGEIVFNPFAAAIAKIKARYGGLAARGGRFVDVGSGSSTLVESGGSVPSSSTIVGTTTTLPSVTTTPAG